MVALKKHPPNQIALDRGKIVVMDNAVNRHKQPVSDLRSGGAAVRAVEVLRGISKVGEMRHQPIANII